MNKKAIIDPSAKIAGNVKIGPFTVIGPNVEIGQDTWIGNNVSIRCNTKIGKGNKIYPFASIGDDPQDLKYHGEETWLEIGNGNKFREFCTINRGTGEGGGITKIGNDNLFMAYTHVAHDCIMGNQIILSNNASLAGHITVDDYAILGGFAAVHQFCHLGTHSFLSAGAMVDKDVLPFVKMAPSVDAHYAKACGLNVVGLKRHNYSNITLLHLRRAYRIIFREGLTIDEAVAGLNAMVDDCPDIQLMIDAIEKSERGISR